MMRNAAVVAFASIASALDNGLAIRPPMGWRSWNLYGSNVNQELMQGIMKGMTSRRNLVDGKPTSLLDLGYSTVGLDDNWQECGAGAKPWTYHDANGDPVVNTGRFPSLLNMTSYAHSLGLKAGWVSLRPAFRASTCQARSPSLLPSSSPPSISMVTTVFVATPVVRTSVTRATSTQRWQQGSMRSSLTVAVQSTTSRNGPTFSLPLLLLSKLRIATGARPFPTQHGVPSAFTARPATFGQTSGRSLGTSRLSSRSLKRISPLLGAGHSESSIRSRLEDDPRNPQFLTYPSRSPLPSSPPTFQSRYARSRL